MSLYENESIFQVLFVTLILGGGCAIMAGRGIALTWRNIGTAAIAMIPLGLAVRFVHFALFNEPLLQPQTYIVETIFLIAAACLALPLAQAATMAKADYKIDKDRISTAYKVDKAVCGALKDNAKDICVEEAKAKEKVGKAELEFNYTGKANDGNKVLVAKEKCDDLAGNTKDVCVKEAKAVEIKALADAKMGKEIGIAKRDAATDKKDADYKVDIEKCDSQTGDVKTLCVSTAKLKFGKS